MLVSGSGIRPVVYLSLGFVPSKTFDELSPPSWLPSQLAQASKASVGALTGAALSFELFTPLRREQLSAASPHSVTVSP